jgi:hypothetical protein
MNTVRTPRAFARLLFAITLSAASLTRALAADPACEATSSARITTLPAPGSIEAWKMAKFPWLYLPKAPATPLTTHFPEPGSAEAVMFYKTPYLMDRHPVAVSAADSGKRWPTPGSAEAVTYYKTPYLINRRPIDDSSCP